MLSSGDSLSCSTENDVEVHTENTGVGVVLNSEINMLLDTETEVAYILKIMTINYLLFYKTINLSKKTRLKKEQRSLSLTRRINVLLSTNRRYKSMTYHHH